MKGDKLFTVCAFVVVYVSAQNGLAQNMEQRTTVPASTALMNPEISLILDFAGAWFSSDSPGQLGGHDPTKNGFNFQQLELHMGSNVDPYFRLDANLVITPEGLELEEAYGSTLSLPLGLKARGGKYMAAFGRLNQQHPHEWYFVDQPLVNGKLLGGEGASGLGVELGWLIPLPWYSELIFSMQEGSVHHHQSDETDGADEAESTSNWPDEFLDFRYTAALKQFHTFGEDWGLMWGVSGLSGPGHDGEGSTTHVTGFDLDLRYQPVACPDRSFVALQTEAMLRYRKSSEVSHWLRDFGLYAQLVWGIDASWELGLRGEYVSGVEDDEESPDWSGNRERIAVQVTYYPTHFSRLRLQGAADQMDWREEPAYSVFLNVEIMIGAHGAHDY